MQDLYQVTINYFTKLEDQLNTKYSQFQQELQQQVEMATEKKKEYKEYLQRIQKQTLSEQMKVDAKEIKIVKKFGIRKTKQKAPR
ncbi:unnamed protein product (macronuclear) [Paramecium tetraurelia]|uniref:Uncharacterized protein n=1 Tax=Paramecium tetraurelia TaxID=5888 RepID=A0DF42_PARTE|nr:uncharacterized protein GSPATT00016472001 [Paramecium tetraurelia]CAK81659.1 unnamed protein product [Paramecium tetraurelia]|eukprot:XP_001449056.1 hypothetical protein (macronuclear) [Paramecium tetraurelia strain d4-2]